MEQLAKYYLIETSALPEIFLKVIQTKMLLEPERPKLSATRFPLLTSAEAPFTSYKDAFSPFQDMISGRIVTFSILLKDIKGTLSAVLNAFAEVGANILTIIRAFPQTAVRL
jgi:chorismate mutase